jgi:hypothetical protein
LTTLSAANVSKVSDNAILTPVWHIPYMPQRVTLRKTAHRQVVGLAETVGRKAILLQTAISRRTLTMLLVATAKRLAISGEIVLNRRTVSVAFGAACTSVKANENRE